MQKYDNKSFAENLMIAVNVDNAQEFWEDVNYLKNSAFASGNQQNNFMELK